MTDSTVTEEHALQEHLHVNTPLCFNLPDPHCDAIYTSKGRLSLAGVYSQVLVQCGFHALYYNHKSVPWEYLSLRIAV